MMKFENILYKKNGKIATITLNRPKYLNALCDQLIKELNDLLDQLAKDDDIHVVVLKGNDKVFAAGADINEMKDLKLISHIKPRFPAVKPTAQKKINSNKSLLPDGMEFNATLIR